ncbi:MAG: nuclear transport factor 2 family protein [Rhizobiales bacterium]|nr:nuclear transport factor 2 family protein [Hyphomicrobiales bacterium]MBO6700148.1 nuclear transport factor 2 family protein [Hyphomicrobiales bacterium]MBO6737687.1 nuclear transport factor 2 family protein [Hyphomicrobiales bacterium]MBO6913256.1 nuclear transport factor 2 family protein [Hyphomicrobiales bacterium]MBO6954300.1 nuclear transport factor 2 family protein [Hyphomicrobiales bacterium]
MTAKHPNVALIEKLDSRDLAATEELFSPEVTFNYVNPNLPEFEGKYVGLDGIRSFFQSLGSKSGGTFKIEPISATAHGDELVVTHTKNTMTMDGDTFAIHAVVVWRIVEGRIVEVWDFPSAYTLADAPQATGDR